MDPIDQVFDLKLPRLPDLQLTREGVAAFASAAGALHGYAVELAMEIKTLTPGQLRQVGERAVARLKDLGGLSREEAEALSGLVAAIDDPDLDHSEEVLRATLAKVAKSGPVATMLLAIARDSMARDRKRAGSHRHLHSLPRIILGWGVDVVAGVVAGVAAGSAAAAAAAAAGVTAPAAPAVGVVTAVVVGTIAASAASAAVLIATS